MFKKFLQNRAKKRLKDKKFEYLFNELENGYVCFDCETTGLNPKKDDILSISAVKIVDNKILFSKKLNLFIKPTKKINKESIKIHRIRECDLNNGTPIDDAIYQFIEFIQGYPLVGYYLEFDIAMVNKYLKPLIGINLPNKEIEVSALYYDKVIKRKSITNIDLKFESIAKDLDIPIFTRHNSLNDAIMTAIMFIKLNRY